MDAKTIHTLVVAGIALAAIWIAFAIISTTCFLRRFNAQQKRMDAHRAEVDAFLHPVQRRRRPL